MLQHRPNFKNQMKLIDNKDTIPVSNLTRALADEAKKIKQISFVLMHHEKALNALLDQVSTINFKQVAGAVDSNDLRKHHYLIIAVETVADLAEEKGWAFRQRDNFCYFFNGAYWKPLGKEELRKFLKQAAERMGVNKYTARYKEFVRDLYEQFLESASQPGLSSNRDTVKINLQNGTFRIGTDQQCLTAHEADDFLTHQLPFAYDESATAPLFQAFLDRVVPDVDCQKVLAEYLGYVFISSAKLKLEKTLLLHGSGANGKSVFFEIVTALLGPDNISHYSLRSLTNEPAYCRAHLANKLANYASEINGKLEADTFKQLVSGEPVEVRMIHKEPWIMKDYAKLIFNCNELPADVEHTHAYYRRFLIVPFAVTIPEAEQDRQLASKIIASELSGVFNWVLGGLRRLLAQKGFTQSELVRQQMESYKHQSDSVRLFLDEQGYRTDSLMYLPLKDVYRAYKEYCAENGYRPVHNRNFRKRLKDNGVEDGRNSSGFIVYLRQDVVAF